METLTPLISDTLDSTFKMAPSQVLATRDFSTLWTDNEVINLLMTRCCFCEAAFDQPMTLHGHLMEEHFHEFIGATQLLEILATKLDRQLVTETTCPYCACAFQVTPSNAHPSRFAAA